MATRRWFLATTCSATSLLAGPLWAVPSHCADRLIAWTDLLRRKEAAARIGKVLADTMTTAARSNLLARQRARFGVAAMPSLQLLHDMMAEDYLQDRTVAARRVVFSEAEAALFLTCYELDIGTLRGADV